MKIIKYTIVASENEPKQFYEKIMGWNAENESIAKSEAYNGKYTITDAELPKRGA